jgi:hypothetical protein
MPAPDAPRPDRSTTRKGSGENASELIVLLSDRPKGGAGWRPQFEWLAVQSDDQKYVNCVASDRLAAKARVSGFKLSCQLDPYRYTQISNFMN